MAHQDFGYRAGPDIQVGSHLLIPFDHLTAPPIPYLEMGDEGRPALDAGVADVADLLAVEALPLLLVEALGQRDDVHGLRAVAGASGGDERGRERERGLQTGATEQVPPPTCVMLMKA